MGDKKMCSVGIPNSASVSRCSWDNYQGCKLILDPQCLRQKTAKSQITVPVMEAKDGVREQRHDGVTTCPAKREESVKTDTGAVSLNDREDAETADGQVTGDVRKMRCTCEEELDLSKCTEFSLNRTRAWEE